MFENYSTEQFQRIIGVISVITSIPAANLNTTVSTLLQLVAGLMFIWGYAKRLGKGDVSVAGFRK